MYPLSRLRALREDQALSIRALAADAGISPSTVLRAEQGHPAYPATVRKLAKALGVSPAALRGPEPVTRGYGAPARPSAAPGLARALAQAEQYRRADNLAEAERWEQIAAGIATAAGQLDAARGELALSEPASRMGHDPA